MPKRTKSGKWLVDLRPEGTTGKRVRKSFDTHAEANRFEAFVMGESVQGRPWNPSFKDSRKFSDLIDIWYQNHGRHLKDHERRYAAVKAICQNMSNPVAITMDAQSFIKYRNAKEGVNGRNINPKTMNNHLGYCNAVFNELYRTDVIDYTNPLAKIRPIKIAEKELNYLNSEQIKEVLTTIEKFSINPHVLLIAKICLSTGCRWGEAEKLTVNRVKNNSVTFTDTKSGKNRTVPIDPKLETEIKNHVKAHKRKDSIFTSSMKAFDRVVKQLSFSLPAGQSTHVLRHTFASHFIMNGGNLLALQKILGHSTINMTMRYAHLSKEHLNQIIKLNPLSRI